MQHPKRTFARLACALTAAVLAWPVALPGAVGEKAAGEPMSLETLRQEVLANEAKTRLIRMEYKNIVDPNDREHLLRNPRVARGKPISHTKLLYACTLKTTLGVM